MMASDSLQEFQDLLRDLFQFDVADLNFGVYRILNEKRDDIERFIEEDLVEGVREELRAYEEGQLEARREELDEAAEKVRSSVSPDAIVNGSIAQKYLDLEDDVRPQAIDDYLEAKEKLEEASLSRETERRIYDDLARFFNRYYDSGDFVTKRRFAARDSKYYVPYDGEEVMLHWANRNQYYIKTTEHFRDYRFTARDVDVHFRLVDAQVPQDNVKADDTRYFVLQGQDPVEVDPEEKRCTIQFAYRPITEEEDEHLLALYNEQQTKSDRRKTNDRSTIVVATTEQILDEIEDPTVHAQLGQPEEGDEKSPLRKHLNRYTAKNTADYFVHKDLGGFLRRQLEFFIQNEVLNLGDVLEASEQRRVHQVDRAKVVKKIGDRIIDFLAQIENFQKRLFEKKKFVVDTGYCVTLDRVPEALYDDILENEEQLDEWRDLYAVDEWDESLFAQGISNSTFTRDFLEAHPHVMIDTKHFDDAFTDALLDHLSGVDEEDGLSGVVDGLCIQGENFQTLDLLQERFREEVQCVYIDPPYNTENDDFLYKDNYRHSTWMSMMENRLAQGRELIKRDGVLYSSVDDREYYRLTGLSDRVFGEENRIASFIWKRRTSTAMRGKPISPDHDYVLLYGKSSEETSLFGLPPDPDDYPYEDEQGRYASTDLTVGMNKDQRPGQFYPITNPRTGETYEPNPERVWRFYPDTMEEVIAQDKIIWPDEEDGDMTRPRYKTYYDPEELSPKPVSTWIEEASTSDTQIEEVETEYITSLLRTNRNEEGGRELRRLLPGVTGYYPKPVSLVRSLVRAATRGGHRVVDFFAGSGTTGQAVMSLNRENDSDRKYVLVEMGAYFDTLLLPRLKKVAFSSNWEEGVPRRKDGMSHVIQYHRLESYEDALNNIQIDRPDAEPSLMNRFDDYALRYMLPHETQDSETLLAPGAFEHPFEYTLRIQHGMESPKAHEVDLESTFNYLIGLQVHTRRVYEHQGRRYVVVTGMVEKEQSIEEVMVVWRNREELDLDAEKEWAAERLPEGPFDTVYVNGPSHIHGKAEPTEITFREQMDPGAG